MMTRSSHPDITYQTNRLTVGPWHSLAAEPDLPEIVATIMIEPVTRMLPPDWQGSFTVERASDWIAERDAEGETLLAVTQPESEPVGLVILFNTSGDQENQDLRLGYMIAESAWGRGFASEIVAGLVEWARRSGRVRSITGGVEADNTASIRVLEKSGFASGEGDHHAERIYTLRLNPGGTV